MDGIIIILGSPNDERGNLSSIAKERLTQGIKEYTGNPGYAILLTGGFGSHFNTTDKPHAFYAKEFLLKAGIPAEEILEFAESRDTVEDALLAKPIVQKYNVSSVIVVTSDFHMERAQRIFKTVFNGVPNGFPPMEFRISFSASKTHISPEGFETLLLHEKKMMEELDKDKDWIKTRAG